MNNFDFNIGNKNLAIVNLTKSGLSFNKSCIKILDYSKYITIGLDREKKILAIKPLSVQDDSIKCYRFVYSEKTKRNVNIISAKLQKEIFMLTNLKPIQHGIKFTADFDSDKNLLIVNLAKHY